jgi:hypothetical protein
MKGAFQRREGIEGRPVLQTKGILQVVGYVSNAPSNDPFKFTPR